MKSFDRYLRDAAVPTEVIDEFLDRSRRCWAQFDPEVGYRLGTSMQHDGLDGCWTISTVRADGARTSHVYADLPCRINTYGNSFTQCHQVSDGETWQEYLAAHLGEPIRNFGMGGFGVYQAYRRMVRTERTGLGAKYVVLYVWGDDHQRSIMRCRHAVTCPSWPPGGGKPFHGNFWASIELDPSSGRFVERENLLPTPESLYRMTDPDFMYDALRDDVMVQLYSLASGAVDPASVDHGPMNAIAGVLGVESVDPGRRDEYKEAIDRVRRSYGFAATRTILDKAAKFCRTHGKELLIVLLCPTATRQLLGGEPRHEREIVEYLDRNGFRYFDMNAVHLADYRSFNLSVDEYLRRYFIGHYSPAGNHFFASSLKGMIVDWLDPKPVTYRDHGGRVVDFEGYLP